MVAPLAPGTLLQLMYLRERLSEFPVGRFVEIGPGTGEITGLLLGAGWTGKAYDLEPITIGALNKRFAKEVGRGELAVSNENYMFAQTGSDVDLIISSMVMEHMDDSDQLNFMTKAAHELRVGGRMIGLVPASPRHWGIEDEIAGHCRRYTRSTLSALIANAGWKLLHIAGLTFPISNTLLPISNFLVQRKEAGKLAMSPLERTKQSGCRRVPFKTNFPPILGFILNPFVLAPFHALQKLSLKSESALVLYFEAEPNPVVSSDNGRR